MEHSAGDRLGPYEILAPLGAGGMGEVYRARDSRLGRDVAIKVLPASAASSPEARARFEREARALSQLHHPRVCAVFDVGQEGGAPYLVMELLEGETLASRIGRGALSTRELLKFAIQIAEGLDAAHRIGVVHRDLKPGNVMVTREGAKLLDFGLARTADAFGGGPPDSSTPPTRSVDLTVEGAIVGTLRNMAPEQLEGGPIDGRTDLFAFGGMIHEMASGKPAFEAKSRASLVAAIMKETPPPLDVLAPETPPALARVVARCLEKDPDDRWQSTRDLLHQLRWIEESITSGSSAANVAASASGSNDAAILGDRRRTSEWFGRSRPGAIRRALVGAAAVALAVASTLFISDRLRRRSFTPPPSWRFEVELQSENGNPYGMAFSPDGRTFAYVVGTVGRGDLWLRASDATTARRVPGTNGAQFPFWSPDGRSIGFFAGGKLKRLDLDGEQVRELCDAAEGRGGTWNAQGTILFAPALETEIHSVSANGGQSRPVLKRVEKGIRSQRWPWFLPDGRHFLYLQLSRPGGVDELRSATLGDSSSALVVDKVGRAEYDGQGHLLFVRDRTLFAQPFDARRRAVTGDPIVIETNVEQSGEEGPTGYAAFAVSSLGALAFAPPFTIAMTNLVWTGRDGAPIDTIGPPALYTEPIFSPDGNWLAVNSRRTESERDDLWLVDLRREIFSRFTFEAASDVAACWSPDGKWIAYSSESDDRANVIRRPVDGNQAAELVIAQDPNGTDVYWSDSWTPDGKYLLLDATTTGVTRKFDLAVVAMDGPFPAEPRPYLSSEFDETHAWPSPNSRWVAYTCNESGIPEIYVQSFPEPGSKWKISEHGGDQATWRADGRELYYLSLDRSLMAVNVSTAGSFEAGRPVRLFEAPTYEPDPDGYRSLFTVSADGTKFLFCATNDPKRTEAIHVRTDWRGALRKGTAPSP